jgi:NitT/TauT family transport system ATP-binding protein
MERDRNGTAEKAAGSFGLTLRGVRHGYESGEGERSPVLDGLDITVRPGEFLSIVGPSGCGKTTLLKTLQGLTRPWEGDVLVGGEPAWKVPPGRVATVFQSDSLLPWRRIWRNVVYGAEMAERRSHRGRKADVQVLLEQVGLGQSADQFPSQLSGGMRQRVNLARALYVEPSVMLMDEPFAALDGQTQEVMQAELLRIWALHKRTVVFVTHRLDEAIYLSDRVVILTQRPARVHSVVDVPFDRPRPLDIKRSPEFNAMLDDLWERLREAAGSTAGIAR